MSIAAIRSSVLSQENTARAGEFARAAVLFARAQGDGLAALQTADAKRSTERVQAILKAAIDPGSTTGATWAHPLADYQQQASDAWLQSLRFNGCFDAMLQDGFKRVPMRTRIAVVTTGFLGSSVGELSAWQVSSLTLTGSAAAGLEPRVAGCICTVTDELRAMASAAAQPLLDAEMRAGVIAAVDKAFLDSLQTSLAATGASAGATLANVYTDVGTMLGAVTVGQNSKPYIVHTPANLKKLMTKTTTNGDLAFPGLSLTGGSMCNLPVVVSDQLTPSTCMMVVADGVMADGGIVTLDWSSSASPQLDTSPDSPVASGTVPTSFFQQNLQGLRASRWFGFEVSRAASAAVSWLSAVNY